MRRRPLPALVGLTALLALMVANRGHDPRQDPGHPRPSWGASVPTRSEPPPQPAVTGRPGPTQTPVQEVPTTGTTVERRPAAVRVQLWGSSSCPQVVTGSRLDEPRRLLVWVEHDGPTDGACTADLAPTSSTVPLPEDLRDIDELEVVVIHLDDEEVGVVGSVHRLR